MTTESIYYNVFLLTVALFPFYIVPTTRKNLVIDVPTPSWGIPFIIFAVWCMANVPIHPGTWTDRGAYADSFIEVVNNGYHFQGFNGETLFTFYTWIVSFFSSDYHFWFYSTALIYVSNYFVAAQRLTGIYGFVLFLSMICCFQYMGYGYNTIRAGFAGSLVILGISFCNRLPVMISLFFFALFCHKSMAIPIGAFAISYFFPTKTKWYLCLWFLCIFVSYFAGSAFESFFSQFVDERRRDSYFFVNAAKSAYRMGFRWDFLCYSALPVALGHYYINALNFRSLFYRWIYNAYLIANSIWILVIRVEFTDRFAYLSWFIFPILLLYPLLTQQLFRDVTMQRKMLICVVWGEFAFAYYMFLAYNGFKPF